MRQVGPLVLLLAGCGVLSSGAGAPTHSPASGVGPVVPWDEEEGLAWAPPFVFADPAVAVGHPSVIVEDTALDCWVELAQAERRVIARMHAPSFADGFGAAVEVLAPALPWHDGAIGAPAVIAGESGRWLFYRAAGRIGLAALGEGGPRLRAEPLYGAGEVLSVAAARAEGRIHLAVLVDDPAGGRVLEVITDEPTLGAALAGGSVTLTPRDTGIGPPRWASRLVDIGLRLERTPAGRWRQDLFLTGLLPSTADLGAQPLPSALGVATRYLGPEETSFVQPELPILTGPPYPKGATAVAYQGGVLVLYGARSGPRDAIAVARHP